MQKSWPVFLGAIVIEAIAVTLLAFCIIAYLEIGDLTKTAGEPDLERLNWFSRYIFDSALDSFKEAGVAKPAEVISTAMSSIFVLGGCSIFVSICSVITIIANAKNPQEAKEV